MATFPLIWDGVGERVLYTTKPNSETTSTPLIKRNRANERIFYVLALANLATVINDDNQNHWIFRMYY